MGTQIGICASLLLSFIYTSTTLSHYFFEKIPFSSFNPSEHQETTLVTCFFFYEHNVYKHTEAQISKKTKHSTIDLIGSLIDFQTAKHSLMGEGFILLTWRYGFMGGGVYQPPFDKLKIGISTDDIKLKLYR